MFFDHGNHGGALVGLLLTVLGAPAWIVWTAFGLAWIRTAYPDLAPLFVREAWELYTRAEDWSYTIRLGFIYSWGEYMRYHYPSPDSSLVMRFDPFLNLHRFADRYAHTVEAKLNPAHARKVYVLTAVPGWIGVAGLIILRSI